MIIGDRLRRLREGKKLSQGDIQNRTGLLRCYLSRVENGHTVPSVATLEKLARALGVHLYQILIGDDERPEVSTVLRGRSIAELDWGDSGKDARMLSKFRHLFSKMKEKDRQKFFSMSQGMVRTRWKRFRRTK